MSASVMEGGVTEVQSTSCSSATAANGANIASFLVFFFSLAQSHRSIASPPMDGGVWGGEGVWLDGQGVESFYFHHVLSRNRIPAS